MSLFKRTRKALALELNWDRRTVAKRLREMGITRRGALSIGEWCKFLSLHNPQKLPPEYLPIAKNLPDYTSYPLFSGTK